MEEFGVLLEEYRAACTEASRQQEKTVAASEELAEELARAETQIEQYEQHTKELEEKCEASHQLLQNTQLALSRALMAKPATPAEAAPKENSVS